MVSCKVVAASRAWGRYSGAQQIPVIQNGDKLHSQLFTVVEPYDWIPAPLPHSTPSSGEPNAMAPCAHTSLYKMDDDKVRPQTFRHFLTRFVSCCGARSTSLAWPLILFPAVTSLMSQMCIRAPRYLQGGNVCAINKLIGSSNAQLKL